MYDVALFRHMLWTALFSSVFTGRPNSLQSQQLQRQACTEFFIEPGRSTRWLGLAPIHKKERKIHGLREEKLNGSAQAYLERNRERFERKK